MKILVSGCSYTEKQTWPSVLLTPKKYHVTNLGKSGAGNNYIANSIMYNADTKPNFVFVLWSGINRTEFRVPNSSFFDQPGTGYTSVKLGYSRYFLSGHSVDPFKGWLAGYNSIKSPDWPNITCLQDWFDLPNYIKTECLNHKIYLSSYGGKENTAAFCHQYYITQHLDTDREYRSECTFQHMINCFNMLEKFKIPYRFSFIYDIWNNDSDHSLGTAAKEKYYNFIDWKKYITLTPFEYGVKHNLLQSDGFHLTTTGMNQWAGEISETLRKEKELQHLFN